MLACMLINRQVLIIVPQTVWKRAKNGVERVESRSSQADSGRVKRWLGWVKHNLNQVQSYTVGPDQPKRRHNGRRRNSGAAAQRSTLVSGKGRWQDGDHTGSNGYLNRGRNRAQRVARWRQG